LSDHAKGLAQTSGFGHAAGSAPLVERPRLLGLVEAGVEGPLTLISAPAGSGKTVLLREWMASAPASETIAHVPLAPEHAGRRAFWLEVLAALARARPELAGLAVPARGAGSLAALRDALAELDDPVRLVLDDFHAVGGGQVAADLEWLIEHAGDRLRLIVATRSDPTLRLQRLRVAGRLKEIRAADLAFTRSEASELLRSTCPRTTSGRYGSARRGGLPGSGLQSSRSRTIPTRRASSRALRGMTAP
jgi:LuxR family transcriptional regulator, maltose regulon positive regulatory protein